MIRSFASQSCPRCHRPFRTLDDEVGDHDCPYCGYTPENEMVDRRLAATDELGDLVE